MIADLRTLWQEAFGDTEEFIDGYFCTAFSPARCRCMVINKKVAAALYWMDVTYKGQRFAYLYALAVELDDHPLNVQNDLGDVFLDAGDRGELMLDTGDLDGSRSSAGQRRKQNSLYTSFLNGTRAQEACPIRTAPMPFSCKIWSFNII